VGDGHTRVRLDDHLKRIEASSRPLFGLDKAELDAAKSNRL
jgi:hypothetical protein